MLTNAGSSVPEKLPARRENTTGLPIFPAELLLEILSYYESIPDPDPNEDYHQKDADAHFAHRERLIALSQTCRNLRLFFLPYIWRYIEVFTGMRASTGEVLNFEEQLALELVRQLEIVTIRDPDLARYVKYVESHILLPSGILALLKNEPY
jgi:hypothetical protein